MKNRLRNPTSVSEKPELDLRSDEWQAPSKSKLWNPFSRSKTDSAGWLLRSVSWSIERIWGPPLILSVVLLFCWAISHGAVWLINSAWKLLIGWIIKLYSY